MIKKRLTTLIAAILLSFSSLFAVSCTGGSVITGIRMSNQEVIDVPFGNFSIDGIKVTVLFDNGGDREIDLSEDMIPEVERLKFFRTGEQNINIVFRDTFTTTMKVNVVLNEFNDVYELVGYTCVYDGEPHEVKLNHELPEGASIVYPKGSTFTNAGEYEVVGVVTKSGYATKTLTTTLTILENEHDEDSIIFADKTVPFNGETQTIEAQNVPEGVSVSYTLYDETKTTQLNKAYYAGKYCFVAKFTNADSNYKKIEDKEAYLTITKIDYDLSDITFTDVVKSYDGQPYTPSISNKDSLPQGIFVHYEMYNEAGNPVVDNTAAGKYTMKAIFTGGDSNHNSIEPMVATLTVAKKIISVKDVLDFDGQEVTFTGEAIYIADPTGLPKGVNFSLDQNGFTYAGEYPVVATFKTVDSNEQVDLETTTVYLLIQPATSSVRVYEGLDDEKQPVYHDLTLKDINIDIDKNEATIDVDNLRLGDDFLDLECGIAIDEENEPLTFKHVTTDPVTGGEIYVPVEPKDFSPYESYQFTVGFKLTNEDTDIETKLNNSLSISPVVGTFKYGYVNTRSGEYAFDGSFTAKNISIDKDAVSIVDVESGVSAKSIKFFNPSTFVEVPVNELVVDNTYKYEVAFDEQESAIFVNETGTFTYKNVLAKNTGSEYIDPFSTQNLLILDGEASLVDIIPGSGVQSISLIDKVNQSATSLDQMVVGHEYEYHLLFSGISEIGENPGTIYKYEDGSFIYKRVKDLTTDEPITTDNISIEADKANILNIDPSIKVDSIKFYLGASEVAVGDLLAGQTYTYAISFRSSDTTLYKLETGSIRIGGPVTVKGTSGEYNSSFSISNLQILYEDTGDYDLVASTREVNPENTVKTIMFFDLDDNEVALDSIEYNEVYKYKIIFNNDDGLNWRTETGSFRYRRIMDVNGVSAFNPYSNLHIQDGVASLVDVTEGLEVLSIKIYDKDTKEEITDLTTLENDHFYYCRITVKSKDEQVWKEEMKDFKYPLS